MSSVGILRFIWINCTGLAKLWRQTSLLWSRPSGISIPKGEVTVNLILDSFHHGKTQSQTQSQCGRDLEGLPEWEGPGQAPQGTHHSDMILSLSPDASFIQGLGTQPNWAWNFLSSQSWPWVLDTLSLASWPRSLFLNCFLLVLILVLFLFSLCVCRYTWGPRTTLDVIPQTLSTLFLRLAWNFPGCMLLVSASSIWDYRHSPSCLFCFVSLFLGFF